jgi:CBS domain-containing protein
MTKKVITADEGTTVFSIAKLMGEKRIGSVVVTRRGEPVGIFTERDLRTAFLERGRSLEVEVGKACSSPLVAVSSGTTIHEAATIMASRHMKRLPIVEDGRMVGIITARDLVEAYAK